MKLTNLFKKQTRKHLVSFSGGREPQSFLVASTEQKKQAQAVSVRGMLENARLIESVYNVSGAVKTVNLTVSGAAYPEDFFDFQNYWDAAKYVPRVARALMIKQSMIWQNGYDLEGTENAVKTVDNFLEEIEADTIIREGGFYALLFGNMYWHVDKDKQPDPLSPLHIGLKLSDDKTEIKNYVQSNTKNKTEILQPNQVLHLRFNAVPWEVFGVSTLINVLPTIKTLLYIEQKLPWLARRLAHPLLEIQLGDNKENTIGEDEFNRLKTLLENRPEGKDIYNDGSILKIDEVFKHVGNSRQLIEPILGYFERNLTAGLGVPEAALGYGQNTTMATAEYQERILMAEILDYQRQLKRFHEQQLFPLVTDEKVKLKWRPIREEDKYRLSEKICREIEHAILSPKAASKILGYSEDDSKDSFILGSLRKITEPQAVPFQSLGEEQQLRLKALRRLAGENDA